MLCPVCGEIKSSKWPCKKCAPNTPAPIVAPHGVSGDKATGTAGETYQPAGQGKAPRVLTFDAAEDEPLGHWNRKYGLDVYSYGLPRSTCTHATPDCKKYCYTKGMWNNIKPRYDRNLEESKKSGFVDRVVAQVERHAVKWIRLHVMGDFYDQAYFNSWVAIATRCPGTRILAFTRNWELDASNVPANLVVYYSIDESTSHQNPTIKRKSHAFKPDPSRVVYIHGERLAKFPDALVCSSRCEGCKRCWDGSVDVALPIRKQSRKQMKVEREPYLLAKSGEHTYKVGGQLVKAAEKLDPYEARTAPPTIEGLSSSLSKEALVAIGFSRELLPLVHDFTISGYDTNDGKFTHVIVNLLERKVKP